MSAHVPKLARDVSAGGWRHPWYVPVSFTPLPMIVYIVAPVAPAWSQTEYVLFGLSPHLASTESPMFLIRATGAPSPEGAFLGPYV